MGDEREEPIMFAKNRQFLIALLGLTAFGLGAAFVVNLREGRLSTYILLGLGALVVGALMWLESQTRR